MTSARLQRYAAFLSGSNYEAIYKKGTENSNIDCLSRAPIELTPNAENAINTEVNQICESLMEIVSTRTHITVILVNVNGCLCYRVIMLSVFSY